MKILYISQEITPFLPESEMSKVNRELPQKISELGHEIRVFMPRYGVINERRHQLHEVIRLSGMNMVINDSDHPLIIKVASIQQARMQVYFIDNEEFFKRKSVINDTKGIFMDDNDERSIFFSKGCLETVKKLGWKPDVIHLSGFMTALVPMFMKELYADAPHFENAKVVYSVYDHGTDEKLSDDLVKKLEYDEIKESAVTCLKNPTINSMHEIAIQYADGVIKGSKDLPKDLEKMIDGSNVPVLEFVEEELDSQKAYEKFYESIAVDIAVTEA
ncbi:MAG: starch synthase [Patiriisocius sp.]|jgi:starch synthase